MKRAVLHGPSVAGVRKELALDALVYNFVRVVLLAAARRQNVPVERLSFVAARRWLRTAKRGTPLPKFVVNPPRPNRSEPRVLK